MEVTRNTVVLHVLINTPNDISELKQNVGRTQDKQLNNYPEVYYLVHFASRLIEKLLLFSLTIGHSLF